MKKNKKLLLLGISAGLLPLAAPVLSLSCSCKIIPAYEKNEFVVAYNAPSYTRAFGYDASRSYGSYNSYAKENYYGGELVRKQPLTSLDVEKTNSVEGSEYKIKTPVFNRIKLELAKAVILTDKDGTVSVFDNDEYDTTFPQPEEGEYYKKALYSVTSSNEKSVNSQKFNEKLTTANKLQFVIREGMHYVDSKGNRTKYQVVPKDFYYSWLRTINLSSSERYANGGNATLDDLARKIYAEQGTLIFSDQEIYNNGYLYDVFGINIDSFADESKFLETVAGTNQPDFDGKKAVTFAGNPAKEPNFSAFFQGTFVEGSKDFMPAPSQYIDEVNESGDYPIYNIGGSKLSNSNKDVKEFIKDLKALPHDKDVFKAGVYWYGSNINNSLFAGPYYPTPLSNQRQELKKNLNYWDEEWVNNENNLKAIIFEYQTKPQDLTLFNDTTFKQYQQGSITQIGFSTLSEAQKQIVLKNYKKFGLRYRFLLNKKSPFYEMVSTPWISNSDQIEKYGFNDAYAKMVYDKTLQELKDGKSTPDSWIGGKGLSFRTILAAAVNWNTLTNNISNGIQEPWLAKVAQGTNIGGSNQSTSTYKTPEDAYNTINSLRAFDKDGNAITFPSVSGEDKTLITPKDNITAASAQATVSEKMKSAGFDVLKGKLAELIAEFDEENPTLAGQEFQMSYFYPYTNPSAQQKAGFESLTKLFRELNPRLNINVIYFNDSDEDINNWRYNGVNGALLDSWSYDFDSIGSGYDGLSWGSALFPTLAKIAYLEGDEATKFKAKFPEVYKLGQALKTYQERNEFVAPIALKDLPKLDPKYLTGTIIVSALKFKLKYDAEKDKYVLADKVPVLDENNEPVKKDGEVVTTRPKFDPGEKEPTDLYQYSAVFWLNFTSSQTNEELIKLMTELSTFINTNLGSGYAKTKEKYATLLIDSHFVSKTIPGYPQNSLQDWLVVKDDDSKK